MFSGKIISWEIIKYSRIAIAFLLLFLSGYGSAIFAASIKDQVRGAVLAYNKKLPEDLGGGISIRSVELRDNTISYNGEEKEVVLWIYDYELNDKYTEKKKVAALERLSKIISVCSSPLTSEAIKNNFILKYQFYQKGGDILIEFFVGDSECKNFNVAGGEISKFEEYWNRGHKKILPVRLDEFTELVTIISKNKSLTYVTRLPVFSKEDLNSGAPKLLSEHAQNSFCNSPDLQILLSYGFKVKNIFVDRNNDEIVRASVKSKDCR